MWIGVRQRFRRFHQNLILSTDQIDDGFGKQFRVRQALERAYYGESSDHPPGFVVGSWGKGTAVAPPTDVDVFFILPVDVYRRFEAYNGNKQSALLQEVKNHLLATYSQTTMRGDGQVVTIRFNSIDVEVVPAFLYDDQGRYCMADTNDGGRWKLVDPKAEISLIDDEDRSANGNVRALAQMAKVWKRECNVPIKSYQIEILAAVFMSQYEYRGHDYFWYDWFFRDFFRFLCGVVNRNLTIPGTGERVNLGEAWLSRAESARDRAAKACVYERDDLTVSAGEEWQKIFGRRIPVHVI